MSRLEDLPESVHTAHVVVLACLAAMAVFATWEGVTSVPVHFDTRNIVSEAFRMLNTGSLFEAIHVARTPEHVQPPFRSVPLVVLIVLIPLQIDVSGALLLYSLYFSLAFYFLTPAVVAILLSQNFDPIPMAAGTVSLCVIYLVYSPLYLTVYTATSLPFCMATLVAAQEVIDRENFRSRLLASFATAAFAALAAFQDTEPGIITVGIASAMFLSSRPLRWKEWLITGFTGLLFIIPFNSQTGGELWYYILISYLVVMESGYTPLDEFFHPEYAGSLVTAVFVGSIALMGYLQYSERISWESIPLYPSTVGIWIATVLIVAFFFREFIQVVYFVSLPILVPGAVSYSVKVLDLDLDVVRRGIRWV